MKHLFTSLFACLLTLLAGVPAVAQSGLHKVRAAAATAPRAASQVTLTQCAAAVYNTGQDGLGNYYIIFSEKGDVTVDLANGTVSASDDNLLFLDLYATASSPIVLPEGTYTAGDSGAMTFSEYTYSSYYNANGAEESANALSAVNVKRADDGTYTITATDVQGATYTYTGKISFVDPSANTHVFPQIGADINVTCTGGMGFYHGNLYESKTGNMYINLFTGAFDPETGGMTETGYNLSLCVFSRLFPDSKQAHVMPGTYTMARNFQTDTYYPGMEIDYMGVTIPFGTYVKQRRAMTGSDTDYAYAYIVDGTITITDGTESGKYNVTVDCITDDGHTVKATATDVEFPVTDLSDDKPAAVVSNLNDDVALNLDYVKTARAYYSGKQNGTHVFTVDIGSPAGRDGNEGDLMRMEFQTGLDANDLREGTYQLMEQNHLWTNLYAPYKLTQGYFTDEGELTGTRYWHFAEGRYQVVDLYAAVISGSVSVERVKGSDTDYHFTIDVADGNGFYIQGEWTGPLEKNYNPADIEVDTGIAQATTAQGNRLTVAYGADGSLTLEGVADDAEVSLYGVDGRLALTQHGAHVAASALPAGVYVVKAAGFAPVKVVKR